MTLSDDERERLSAYLDDEVSPVERAAVERLLSESAEARQALKELRQVAQAVGGLERAAVPRDLTDRVTERLERAALLGNVPAGKSERSRTWMAGLAAAAVIGLVVTIKMMSSSGLQVTEVSESPLKVADAESAVANGDETMKSVGNERGNLFGAPVKPQTDHAIVPAESETTASPQGRTRELAIPSATGMTKSVAESIARDTSVIEEDDATAHDGHENLYVLSDIKAERSNESMPKRADTESRVVRALARMEDRDEILFKVFEFVSASDEAEFVEADVSPMALLLPGLDWLMLGIPTGGANHIADELAVLVDESVAPDLYAMLQPTMRIRYELGTVTAGEVQVAPGRLGGPENEFNANQVEGRQGGYGGGAARQQDGALAPPAAVAGRGVAPSARTTPSTSPAPRRIKLIITFQNVTPPAPASQNARESIPTGGVRP